MNISEAQLRRMIREEFMREEYSNWREGEEDKRDTVDSLSDIAANVASGTGTWASALADPRTPEHIRDMIRNTPGLVPDEDEGGEFSLDPEKIARAQEESPGFQSAFVRGETHGQARARLGTNENLASQAANVMKITKVQLKQIIKEELNTVFKEGFMDDLMATGQANPSAGS